VSGGGSGHVAGQGVVVKCTSSVTNETILESSWANTPRCGRAGIEENLGETAELAHEDPLTLDRSSAPCQRSPLHHFIHQGFDHSDPGIARAFDRLDQQATLRSTMRF
jgi:hypothetical protein